MIPSSVCLFVLTELFYLFLIGGKLLYNFVLVSAVQQHESVILIYIYMCLYIYIYIYVYICIYIYIPSLPLFPLLPSSHPSRSSQSSRLGSLCYLATSRYFFYT